MALKAPAVAVADDGRPRFVVLNWYSGRAVPWLFDDAGLSAVDVTPLALSPGYEGHAYVVVSPVLYFGAGSGGGADGSNADKTLGFAFVGEGTSRYVPCSGLRFPSVVTSASGIVVTVAGVAWEVVQVFATVVEIARVPCNPPPNQLPVLLW